MEKDKKIESHFDSYLYKLVIIFNKDKKVHKKMINDIDYYL